jgi:hypothetical protein
VKQEGQPQKPKISAPGLLPPRRNRSAKYRRAISTAAGM